MVVRILTNTTKATKSVEVVRLREICIRKQMVLPEPGNEMERRWAAEGVLPVTNQQQVAS